MKVIRGIGIAALLIASVLGLGTLAATPAAHAGDQYMDSDYRRDEIDARRAEVRALEKIAAQLDRINDTLRECRR